jgi:hypothetical protein
MGKKGKELVVPPGLYVDDDGRTINTHSMLKTFRRCPKQAEFKYVHRLKPRLLGSPLKRGVWIHALLEEYHAGRDWRIVHRKYCAQFAKLFDEEKDFYGDMPQEIETLMRAYIWHYKNDPWIVHEVELTVEAELPDGSIYRGKVDALIENQFGLWLVDHKSHKTLPDHNFRLLDSQSALYIWAAQQMGIPVLGFIWNYIRWKAPSKPKLLKDGTRLSKSPCDTDYPTYVRAIKEYKEANPNFVVTKEYIDKANHLQKLRYQPGMPQESTFFRRDVLEKSPEMIRRVVAENFHTARRMNAYDFSDEAAVERVVERSCSFSCSYVDLCTADLMGANIRPLVKQNYTVGDPNDYYNDRAGDHDKEQR